MTELNDLRQLRAFVQVADSGSISAAARILGFAQPTLSRQLKALEQIVGLSLIRRNTHSLSLTEAGRTLLPDARRVIVMADRMRQRLRVESDSLQGHLRIVSVVDIGQWVISRLLANFQALHPRITAELHLINRPTKFIEEGFDCGILVGDPVDKSLVVRRIATLPRVLAAAPALLERYGVPQRPEDLRSLPWLGVLQPHFFMQSRFVLRSTDRELELTIKPALLLDTVTALREAALSGAGFTMLPHWLASEDIANGTLVPLLSGWTLPDIDLCISYAVDYQPTGRLRAFIDFVLTEVPLILTEQYRPGALV